MYFRIHTVRSYTINKYKGTSFISSHICQHHKMRWHASYHGHVHVVHFSIIFFSFHSGTSWTLDGMFQDYTGFYFWYPYFGSSFILWWRLLLTVDYDTDMPTSWCFLSGQLSLKHYSFLFIQGKNSSSTTVGFFWDFWCSWAH